MGHRQKGKRMKRLRSWHRGRGEAARSIAALRHLPDTGTPADPALAQPIDARKGGPSRNRGPAI